MGTGGGNDALYWYGQSGEVLLETDLAGNLQNEYIFFNGQRVARYDLYGYVDFYLGDHLGSVRLDTDVFGNPLDDSDYYPFGGERVALANSSNHYKFTGLERDSESGLDHTLFRQYSSTQGRWMTPDPAGLAAADAANPQSWNRYAYAMNSPTNTTDALGLEPSWNDDLTGGGGGFGYGGLFGGDGTGYCPPAYANCDDSPFGGIGITIVFGGSPHGGDGSAPTSSTSGGSPNAPHIGGTFPNGESLGIPNGMPLRPLSIWQLLNMVPVDNWCDYGPCSFGANNGTSQTHWYNNPCVTSALGKGALTVGIDAIGLIPEAGGVARVIGHQAGYVGVVADQLGSKVIKSVGASTSSVQGLAGLSDTSPDGLISTGLTIAGFIPGFGQAASIGSIGLDIYKTAKAIGRCH